MSLWQNYHRAVSVDEALKLLSGAPKPCAIVAGGTDLLLDLQQGGRPVLHTLIDISQIAELQCLESRGTELFIGAAVPVNRVAESALVQSKAAAVADACALIGGPQVRNSATLGGNVAHALPAADGMIALLALDAQVEVASLTGRVRRHLLDLFLGPGKTALAVEKELITGFYLPVDRERSGSAFSRVMRPQGVALPMLNLAAWLQRSDGEIADIHIAIGPAGPTPRRAEAVETFLKGKPFSGANLQHAAALLRETILFRTSKHRASSAYRAEISGVLLDEVLRRAWERASLVE